MLTVATTPQIWAHLKSLTLACAVALALAACGGGGGGSDPAPAANATGTAGTGTLPAGTTNTGITSTGTPSAGTPTAAGGCGVSQAAFTAGNTFTVNTQIYRADGTVQGTQGLSIVNRAGVTFNAISTVEAAGTSTTTTGGNTVAGQINSYNNIAGTNQLLYGVNLQTSGLQINTSYSPPLQRVVSPALNVPESQTVTQTVQTLISAAGGVTSSPPSTSSYSITRVGLAIETITVPAGTVSVCRSNVDTVTGGTNSQQTHYTLATGNCKGQIARLVDRVTGRTSFEMTSATFNGASCV